LDYGGLAREWLQLVTNQMLNPDYGLFVHTNQHRHSVQINSESAINEDHLSYYYFVGRVLGLALFHGHQVSARFTRCFFKMLLGKNVQLEDILLVDEELYRSLKWILSTDLSEFGPEVTFSVERNNYGRVETKELKKGGSEIRVNESNKEEYVQLFVQYRFRLGIEQQFLSLQKGFNELIPVDLLKSLTDVELERIFRGREQIDVADWKRNTRFKCCTELDPISKWFFEIVESFDDEMRARLLEFITGSPRLPMSGFSALQGSNSSVKLFTLNVLVDGSSTDLLPKAHTCFNRLDIPKYESKEKFTEKLTLAVLETCGFTIE